MICYRLKARGSFPTTALVTLAVLALACLPAHAQTEYQVSGVTIQTVDNQGVFEDGVYVASAPLPDQDVLMIPYYFEGEPAGSALAITFDGAPLEVLFGLPLADGAVEFLYVDIADVRSQTGSLRITLSSTGSPAQFMLIDSIQVSDTDTDTDGDGIADAADNCVSIGNADQRDTDADGFGNACDADLNNDCIVNAVDLGLFKPVFFTGDADADFNGDGIVNVIDLGILKSRFFTAPGPSGLPNACE